MASEVDLPAIDALRLAAYAGASYFRLKDTDYLRTAADPAGSLVLCAWEQERLVATLRLSAARTEHEAAELLGFAAPRPVSLQAAVFSRGAVDPDSQGQGWMPFMLTLGLDLAEQRGFASALGAQAQGTPHQRAMVRSGWQVCDVGTMTHAALDMQTIAQYLWIERNGFAGAVSFGRDKAKLLEAQCSGWAWHVQAAGSGG